MEDLQNRPIFVRNQQQRAPTPPDLGREPGANECESNEWAVKLTQQALNGLMEINTVR